MPGLNLGDTVPDFDAETSVGPIKFHEWIGDRCVFPMDSTYLHRAFATHCIMHSRLFFSSYPFKLNGHVCKTLCDANPG